VDRRSDSWTGHRLTDDARAWYFGSSNVIETQDLAEESIGIKSTGLLAFHGKYNEQIRSVKITGNNGARASLVPVRLLAAQIRCIRSSVNDTPPPVMGVVRGGSRWTFIGSTGTYELFRHYYALPSARDQYGCEVDVVRGVLAPLAGVIAAS
jgi:hypothetical protein